MPEQVQEPVAEVQGMRPDAELVLTHLDSLPTLPPIALRVLQITADAESDAEDIIETIRGDQSLTAKILSLANSAWTGVRSSVTTLEKAVPLLGFSTIRGIVLSVSIFDRFPADGAGAEPRVLSRREFWKHSVAVACAAQELARLRPELAVTPQDAFVAGLLHDIGKVALSAIFPKAYDRAAGRSDDARGDVADFERMILGVDHTVAGRRLAERWRLPRPFQEAIWLHHLAAETLPVSVQSPELVGLARLADTLAREQRIGYSGNYMFYDHSPTLGSRMGFDEVQLNRVSAGLFRQVADFAELLGLDNEATEKLYVEAMTRANTELGKLNTELALRSQRLAAGARYFRAIAQFDQLLNAWSDPPAVVNAMAEAGAKAFQRRRVLAFGIRDQNTALDVAVRTGDDEPMTTSSRPIGEALEHWLREPGEALSRPIVHGPAPVAAFLNGVVALGGQGSAWLVPVVHEQRIIGGLLFLSESDEHSRFAGEEEDMKSFIASLGLALGRANAQAAARRLSDDLAETNRRLQQMQVELLRSRTLSMIAEMAAGAGHELNSPLTVISGRAQMLAQELPAPEHQRALKLIAGKAHECSKIVTELMDFARPRAPQLEPTDLGELLSEVRLEWLAEAELAPSQVRLSIGTDGGGVQRPLRVPAEPAQLKTLLCELLANATDAISEKQGTISVLCRPAVLDGFVEIIVTDTGCGMPPNVLQRAFDPFFSHRRAGRGRGLGLPRAYRIVEGHGGRIWLESVPDEGTTAHILLPTAARNGAARERGR